MPARERALLRRGYALAATLALATTLLGGCDGDEPALDGGVADASAAGCDDGLRNQDETDVDCGGGCPACGVGQACGGDGDCASAVCEAGACVAAPSCDDGARSGTETDVDCGGSACPPCADGATCARGADCASGACAGGACAPAACGDGVVNGEEACDDGGGGSAVSSARCDADCTEARCGDGFVNPRAGEACDGDGEGAGGETPRCDPDCTEAVCGDGRINAAAGESCDGDGAGGGGETASCDEDCTAPACGDGVRNEAAGEACDDGNGDDADRCDSACRPTGADLVIADDAVLDTAAGTLDGAPLGGWDPASRRLTVADLVVAPRAVLRVVGDAPLHVLAAGRVRVEGTVDVSGADGGPAPDCNAPGGEGGAPGPGGFAGGEGGRLGPTVDGAPGLGPGGGGPGTGDDASGGGGGHAAAGDDGAASGSGVPGRGGAAYTSLVTQSGGSGGGGGSADDDDPRGFDAEDDGGGGGGGGGGALILDALGEIVIRGVVDARGGDGGASGCSAGGGGGGAGGTVLLISSRAIDDVFGVLEVSGGRGAGDGGDGAPGEIYVGPPPSCADGARNQDETDVDCGGTCGPCPARGRCSADADCGALSCLGGSCQSAGCADGVQGGLETDVDCGGATCLPCDDGAACAGDDDCEGSCEGGACVSCADGVRNQDETDVDCGGARCAPCADGLACGSDADCAGSCESGACVSCSDGTRNGAETDVDCGGPACAACPGGATCRAFRDCLSGRCDAGTCDGEARSCRDILTRYPGTPSGAYRVQPDPAQPAREVWCDMRTDGGGWTLVGSSRGAALDDVATSYYGDLARPSPEGPNAGLWLGMRPLSMGPSDLRFTCRRIPGLGPYDVDLSFYASDMYRSFTEGDDAASCGRTYGAMSAPAFPARRDNLTGRALPEGDRYDCAPESVGPIVEDFCGDRGDFTVDFDDQGMDCDASDGTDWGEDDATLKCGVAGLTDGEWHVWVRE